MDMISVVVPTYNNAPWLPGCLDSLLAQTHENLQIVVVDDGSVDETADILREYAEKSERICVIRQENRGVTAARLRGVAEARGNWIGFCDGDDRVEPEMFARLLKNARTYGADISHCGYRLVFPDGRSETHGGDNAPQVQDHIRGLQDLLEERTVEPGLVTKLFRRELFCGLEAWMDGTIKNNEDMLMNFYLFSQGETSVFEDWCGYCYQARTGSASRGGMTYHRIYDPIRVRRRILEECTPELRDAARQALLRCQLYVYAQLTLERDRIFLPDKKRVRQMIGEQSGYYHLLTPRNQILCQLIRLCPGLFHLAFRAYVAVALHGRYE